MIDHALFIRNVLFSEASKFLKLDVELIHRHVALLEIAELLMLALSNAWWNVMSFEVSAEIIPGNHTTSSGISVLLIPLCSLVFELEGGELDKVLRPDVTALEMLAYVHEPIISVYGLDTVTEGLRLVYEELVEGGKLSLIVAMALISLVALLQELHDQLRVCIGSGHHSLPCLRRWRWWWWILIPILTLSRSHPEEGDIR